MMMQLDDELLEHIKLRRHDEALSLLQNQHFSHLNDDKKSNFLHYAAECGNTYIAQHLINLGADVNAQNSLGVTPLMLAVQNYHRLMVQLLLKFGADMFVVDNSGENILKKINRNTEVKMSIIRTELLKKITSEFLYTSEYFNSRAFHEYCPIYHFIPLRDVKVTKILLNRGSLVDARPNETHKTALHLAAQYLDVAHVNLLISYGADVNAKDSQQKKPLSYITDYKNDKAVKIAKILIQAGTKLTEYSSTERLIELVLTNCNGEIIKAILQTGIDLYTKTKDSSAPIEYIFKNRNPDVYEALRNFKIDLDKCTFLLLHRAVSETNESLTQYLLECGVDVHLKDHLGPTPLCMALEPIYSSSPMTDFIKNRWNCMDMLFDYGADPQIVTKENRTHIPGFSIYGYVNNHTVEIIRPILAHLALYEMTGRSINSFMLSGIKKQLEFRDIFEESKKEFEKMKKIKIDDSLCLLDFFMTKRVAIFVGSKILMSNLTSQIKKYNSDSYFHYRLQTKFEKLDRLVAINDAFVKYHNVSGIDVAEKIVSYLY